MGNEATWQGAAISGRFAGKAVIVTGAASGIGRATALRIATGGGRVIAAPAFLARPSVLILDEATSSVDTRTEVLVQKAMSALRSDQTSSVIAHRLSTVRVAGLILVMEAGQIVE